MELHELRKTVKDLEKKAKHLNQIRNQILKTKEGVESEYEIAYAKMDWDKKIGKYFKVNGFEEEEFFCHIINRDDLGVHVEYFKPGDEKISLMNVDDPTEDCGYRLWVELSEKEYDSQKHL